MYASGDGAIPLQVGWAPGGAPPGHGWSRRPTTWLVSSLIASCRPSS